jgi:hypothetical protein
MKSGFLLILFISIQTTLTAQYYPGEIRSDFATSKQRDGLKKMLYERTIGNSFSVPLDTNSQFQYQSAFWAISQFIVYNETVKKGFTNSFAAYSDTLAVETRRSFMEALYALYPRAFADEVKRIATVEKNPKVFAMIQLWLLRYDPSKKNTILRQIDDFARLNPGNELIRALQDHVMQMKPVAPSLTDLFSYQQTHGQKVIYSFQNSNRDLPGFAVIQHADGSFARDGNGKVIRIPQLARAASNLPYFLTNGNTPQGIYSIQGIAKSNNNFIGPTPNLQLTLPHEYYWKDFFHEPIDTTDLLDAYKSLLPRSWENFGPMLESFRAGKIGRTEIIAHGTTIDPKYFTGKSFFPVSPTLGCLCAKEIWDPSSGRLVDSDQLKLVNAFLQTPGSKGYFMVIEYDGKAAELAVENYRH